jgi:hypothetical protein
LLFSAAVDLMSLAVCKVHRSVNAASKACQERIGVSLPAVSSKLSRMEVGITNALVAHTAERLQPVIQQLRAALPSPVPGYRVRILDGNHLAATERRLSELPGKSIAIPEALWDELSKMKARAFAKWLRGIAEQADLGKYQKQPRGPKTERKKPKRDKRKPHVSTARLLQGRR